MIPQKGKSVGSLWITLGHILLFYPNPVAGLSDKLRKDHVLQTRKLKGKFFVLFRPLHSPEWFRLC